MIKSFRFLIIFVLGCICVPKNFLAQCSQLFVNAGNNKSIFIGDDVQIGGVVSVINTLPNSSYSLIWSPSYNINSVYSPNPTVSPLTDTTYTLTVYRTDSLGNVCTESDDVIVNVTPVNLNPKNIVTLSGSGVKIIETCDLDGDNDDDLVIYNENSDNIGWLETTDVSGLIFIHGKALFPTKLKAQLVIRAV